MEMKRISKHAKKGKAFLAPWLFLLPALAVIIAFYIVPIFESFAWSVLDYQLILGEGEFVGLDNFRYIFQDSLFWLALTNSIVFLLLVLPMNIFLPMILASLVNQKLRGVGAFRLFYYLPVVTPMVVAALMWGMLYTESGLIGRLVFQLGLFDRPTNLLMQTATALFAVSVITVWKGLGYYMMIYLSGLQSISDEIYEAADIDGASFIQKFFRITVPMLTPSVTLVSVMTIINGLKVFEEIALTTGGGPSGATTTLVMYIFDKFMDLDVSTASAAGIILLLLAVGGSLLQMRISKSKEEDLKG
ncbi:carbohydrate ABC transporter membrane protein 1, CUT1 family [Pelagirhabdus alkalitolerans]|uniref:Carbohydrate ABC transporter membrane protein 1, CUT1 family n=1 Tax=Pelagirhabdus alkalitolerans TaxID=1612202 RepID=A0A1G6LG47_9BACI|nr:sugar ABC transporter permease [Pelagirhabdus alkalitolerans]SDC42201.1 carbohydrate ABC transporter membrane protein 1, CUT1 family [Pelagirhabdus alkalitolerans]